MSRIDVRTVLAAQRGDQTAAEELFARAQPFLRAAAARNASWLGWADAYADACLGFSKALRAWRPPPPGVSASWAAWMQRGVWLELQRSRQRVQARAHINHQPEEWVDVASGAPSPLDGAEAAEALRRLRKVAGTKRDAAKVLAVLLGEADKRRGPKIAGKSRWYAVQQIAAKVASDERAERWRGRR